MFKTMRPIPKRLHIGLIAAHFSLLSRTSDHGFLWPVARGLAQRGHDVTIFSFKHPDHQPEVQRDGVKILFLGEPHLTSSSSFAELVEKKFIELHQQKPFDVIHSLDSNAWLIGKSKQKYRIALLYDVEATQLSQIFSILSMSQETLASLFRTAINVVYKFLTTYFGRDRKLLKTADAIFVTSPPQRLALERYYLYPEMKTHLVPYGIELGDLSPREKSDELRRKLNLPEGGQVIVTVSDMTELAETQNLLRAFERVAIKRPSARLLIVGNGPLFKQIEYEMLCLALGHRVIFTGAVTSSMLADYISLADVFVSLSARTSGFEPSLLEAMAQKKVIVGSEVSPISSLVEDGVNGFLIRPADISTLAELFHQIFSGEIEAHKIGERAREKVVKLFDASRMVDQTLAAYQGALRASGFFSHSI